MILVRTLLIGLLWLASTAGALAAGRVTLAQGGAEIESGGATRSLRRGERVVEGDLLRVATGGLVQLRMDDGALIALKGGTEFRIDTYRATASASQRPRAVLRLLKGGFRTISGLIGRFNHDEYEVATPIATIGIRGTDFSTLFCANDCKSAENGLHARVSEGAILLRNLAGIELLLTEGEYGFLPDGTTPPERRRRAPDEMSIEIPPTQMLASLENLASRAPAPHDGPSTDGDDHEPKLIAYEPPEPSERFRASGGSPLALAFSAVDAGGADVRVSGETQRADDGALLAFFGSGSVYAIGDAQTRDSGFDEITGLRWGRWAEGTGSRDGAPLALTEQSLHWIYDAGLDGSGALPRTGSASWTLVGNTNPTDDRGQVGFLGSATLSADFTNQTVDSSLQLGFGNGSVWQASGSGTIETGAPLFGGDYDRVTVDGVAGGDGRFDGFFVPGADGEIPLGAGMSYTLGNEGTTVNGTAAFGNPVGAQP